MREHTFILDDVAIQDVETVRILAGLKNQAKALEVSVVSTKKVLQRQVEGYEYVEVPMKYNLKKRLEKNPDLFDLFNDDEVIDWLRELKRRKEMN
jgi:hypothetical protein